MLMAARIVLIRETSAAWTVEVSPWRTFSSTSNLRMMMKMTSEESTTTAKPRKITMGVLEIAKAGCVKKSIRKVMAKMPANQAICR